MEEMAEEIMRSRTFKQLQRKVKMGAVLTDDEEEL